jgi:hypothetical protein
MVFYYLTPAGFRRYSSSNLCPALASRGGVEAERNRGGIRVVNPADDALILMSEALSAQTTISAPLVAAGTRGRGRSRHT